MTRQKVYLSSLLPSLIISLFFLSNFFITKGSIVFAQSQNWIKYKNNPLTPQSWNAKTPFVLQDDSDFKMYYTAPYNGGLSINVASSNTALDWEIIQEDIIFPTPDADPNWKETRVANPTVIKNGNMYRMWYDSNILGSKNFKPGEPRFRIQYATSNNGLDWNRKGLAIKPEESWEAEGVSGAMVTYSASQYHMWYAGRDKFGVWKIGYATSSNGEDWVKHPNNPVLEATETWEYANSTIPTVALPSVIEENGTYTMFYSVGSQVPGYEIGYAVSDNGITWAKPDNNPLLSRDANSFDSHQIDSPYVITKEKELWMYYAGYNGSNWSIGLATMEEVKSEKDVVIIVPGIFASYDPFAYATCSETDWSDWKMLPGVTEYTGLIETLKNAGYEYNKDLFLFPYDWRKALKDSANDLKSFIEIEVKPKNPDAKIDLIGHSLGGLVARSYLQEYANGLVDQLVTVGSPHHGKMEAYKPWAGGELPEEKAMRIAASFVVAICKIRKGALTNKGAIQKAAPVFHDLLPTSAYLRDNSTHLEIGYKGLGEEFTNPYLIGLNEEFPSYFSKFDSVISTKFDTPKFYDVAVYLEDQILGIYPFGRPVNIRVYDPGDEAVLASSGTFEGDPFHDLSLDHRELIFKKEAIEKILTILKISSSEIVEGKRTTIKPSLTLILRSPAVLSVRGPNNEILVSDVKFAFLPGFDSGQYEIEITGTDSGLYELLVGQFTDNGIQWDSYQNTTVPDKKDTYAFEFDTKKSVPIPLIDLTATDHINSARQKLLSLQNIQNSNYLQRALRILDRTEYFINNGHDRVATYYVLRAIRYLLHYKKSTDNIEAKNASLNTVSNLEAAYAILAQNARLSKHLGRSTYNWVSRYAGIIEQRFQTQAEKGKATPVQAAAFVQGNEKLKMAEEALAENQFYRAEILSWSAFYLFKEAR